jgi:ferredoxin
VIATIRVEPLGVEFGARAGESIMAAAKRAGYHWPTVCGGMGSCRTCFVKVIHGLGELPQPSPYEEEGLRSLKNVVANIEVVRLACQTCPSTDVVVEKRGVRWVGRSTATAES